MVISHSITPLDNSSILKDKRKDIARINTEIRAREINKA
ncbi:MAG: large ribosomal subunit protein uL29 [Candidatus Saccharimonadaceae bacterium]